LERETGFEPATSTLARLHSTAELFPHYEKNTSDAILKCQPIFEAFKSPYGSALPQHQWAEANRSSILVIPAKERHASRFAAGASKLSQLGEVEPNPGSIHFNLALCYERLGRIREAKEELQQVLRKQANFAKAEDRLARLNGNGAKPHH
jgi:tetratricopeptide (TPR) repeat protein